MKLKIYQENAVEELLERTKRLLHYSGEKKLVFKAPTGSGKTIMMAEFLKQLVDDRGVRAELSFIWTAPRKLHIQSRGKLETYFAECRALECSFFEDLDDRKIKENEILFFNWESINKADNVYIRDNEQDFNLSKVIERTREEEREIILVIDEAHHHAESDISLGLRDMMGPRLTIEVSATPKMIDPDETVNVQIEDVKAEGMIKKAVILNAEFVNLIKEGKIDTELSKGSEELVVGAALKKRDELFNVFRNEKAEINPLVLIQLPDRKGQLEDIIKERIIRILKDKHNISTERENNKLAIWLSGEHVNKEDVERNDSPVEVLIFKQAIALGWDCPRAQILALFREWHSPIFSIQTVGRIMRMPEPDVGHYANDILNYGYVYTNLSDIVIQEDIARDYITIYESKRGEQYKPLALRSCHAERHREITRLSPLYIEIFLKKAQNYNLSKKIDVKSIKLDLQVFNNWKADNIDALAGAPIAGDAKISASASDMQQIFDFFVRESLTPLYPEDRSVGRIKISIYSFFEKEFKTKRAEDENNIIRIVLSEKNTQHFKNVIDEAKMDYLKEISERKPAIVFDEKWDVRERINYNASYTKTAVKKSIMKPFYFDDRWKTEKAFIDFLEKSNNVEWWFKNGDRDATFFAVPYKEDYEKPFYVDFIVKLKDGRIALFDPHSTHLSDFRPKADGLYIYIQNGNKEGKKLFGGIVANTDQRNYSGRWVYFDLPSSEFKDNDFANWKTLEL